MYYVSFSCDNHFYEMLFNKKYELEVDWFFNNSYVFDLCKNYIKLYRSKEVELYKFKKEYLRG